MKSLLADPLPDLFQGWQEVWMVVMILQLFLRRTVSRLSGDIAGLTSQMSQFMGLVQFQQAQLTELAGRPPTVVQQPVFTDYGIPRSPSPTRTVQGSLQVRQPFDSPPTASGFVDMATGSSNQNQDPSSRFDAGASFPEPPGPPQQGSGPQPSATVTGSQASPAAMIVLPDGTQIPLGPVSPATSPTGAAANTGSIFGQNSQLDAFQKSDKWLPFFFWLVAAWVKSRAERPSVSVVNRQLHVQIGCKLGIRNRKDELEASKAKQITN